MQLFHGWESARFKNMTPESIYGRGSGFHLTTTGFGLLGAIDTAAPDKPLRASFRNAATFRAITPTRTSTSSSVAERSRAAVSSRRPQCRTSYVFVSASPWAYTRRPPGKFRAVT